MRLEEYAVIKELPCKREQFEIRNLRLENILIDEVTVPSLGKTVKFFSVFGKYSYFLTPLPLLAIAFSGGKIIYFPGEKHRYVPAVVSACLHAQYPRVIAHSIDDWTLDYPYSDSDNIKKRIRVADLTAKERVVYIP
jgi:hypothetical protein